MLDDFLKSRSTSRQGQTSVIFFSLFVIANRIETDFGNTLSDFSLKQLMVLILLEINGPMSYTDLGKMMGSSRQNIKNLCAGLKKKSYVSIGVDDLDKRAAKVQTSQKTKDHFNHANDLYDLKIEELFSELTDKDVENLFEYSEKLFLGLEKMEKVNE